MKILSRDFTALEKFLLLALSIALIGLIYYQFVYVPVQEDMGTARIRREELLTEVDIMQAHLRQLNRMEEELIQIGASETVVSRMPSYNSSSEEIALLNSLFGPTDRYSVQFASVTKSGDLIRRGFSLQFTTDSFARARSIIARLTGSQYRCLLRTLSYSVNVNAGSEGRIVVSTEGFFYETMVGGTPDVALPS